MASLFAVLVTLRLLETACAEPAPSYPFNAQLPPVARIDRLFSYSFSPNTFTSNSDITYSLGHHPSWLSIDKGSRRLYGTPKDEDIPAGDVVGQQFDLIATDGIGSTSMNATVVISRNPPPSIKIPVSQQMDSLGTFSAPSSLLSYPSTDFRYTFDPSTFGDGHNFSYYASTNDSTPLPAWITFDQQTLTFSGRTPAFESLIQPPQKFDFSLVASDVVGFAGTALSFAIVVGSHRLTTDHPIIQLNATRGSKIGFDGLANGIQLDDKDVKPSSLNVSTENMPSWLSFDPTTLLLEGTPTSNDGSANFKIVIRDTFADVLNIHVRADVGTGLFQSNLKRDIEIQPGDDFSLDLSSYLRDPKDIDLKVDLDPEPGWLHVDGLKISGNAPKMAKGKFKMSIKATSKSTGLSESETLQAAFLSPDETKSSPTSHTSDSTRPASMNSEDAPSRRMNTTDILLATILPVLFLTFAIMLIVCVMRRRRHRRTYISSAKHRPKISDPIRFTMRNNESDEETIYHAEKTIGSKSSKKSNTQLPIFKKGNGIFAEVASRMSSMSKRSGTLRGVSIPRRTYAEPMASGARPDTARSVSPLDEEDQASWFTVERTTASGRSHKARNSCHSDTTLPEAAQLYLPTSSFLTEAGESAFRSGLDLTLPSLDDLANIQPMSVAAHNVSRERGISGMFSDITSSSAALPSVLSTVQDLQEPFDPSLVSRAKHSVTEATAKEKGPVTEAETEGETAESISELKQPSQARISSNKWFSHRGSSWTNKTSMSNRAKSFQTEPSFGSNENWRPLGKKDASVGYLELLDETPFLPSRSASKNNNVSQLEERRSLELMSPSKWGEDERKSTVIRPTRPTSAMSLMSEGGKSSVFGEREAAAKSKAVTDWRREDSAAKVSERSFKMFI
ncbi:hypothetical protein TRIATDRAFT_296667 [Trichoderma atroviride IMI 206040]|uniref:Dystroglycan-type cadherin-like domain-containing protein n=2 Tax=Hypocrea atroviridis TaxID=63577 RepID=G9PBB2_HYPAI|nr:uncharacterized protein TRIATDRAFT_296667 [Trichoderma atroviride IMI 206040]EHK39660.1 hypothetical protein TRIATDRAFT_296667 [Trichoderma atroviride IMI 206040]